MNTLKTTMSKIAQIEQPERTDLAKHEVELALVDDLMKATTILINEEKKSEQLRKDISVALFNVKQTKKALLNQLNGLDTPINNILQISNKIESAAKELGISAGDVVNVAKKKINDVEINRNATIKTYQLNDIK